MENKKNLFIASTYRLYTMENGEKKLIEEATEERPFVFVSNFGMVLEAFEAELMKLKTDEEFTINLKQEEAYGPYFEDRIVELEREAFSINGHFDHDNVFEGAMIPLQNNEGDRFMGRVMNIGDEKVRLDLNHPLAGKDLTFEGKVIELREANESEIQQTIKMLSGEGCGCGNCGDDCDHHHHEDGGCGCGCGHCH